MVIAFWILLGVSCATVFLALAKVKPEQESQILAVGLVVAALIYVGFAVVAEANPSWVATEIAGVGAYGLLAVLGLRYSNCWLVLGWIAHPIWDIGLHLVGNGALFTLAEYAIACVSFDLLVASYIAGIQLEIFNSRRQNYES